METSTALAKVMNVDSKISRSEVIDLVIEEMASELDDEIEQLKERADELQEKTFSFDEVKHLLGKVRFVVSHDHYSHQSKKTARDIEFNYESRVTVTERDPILGAFITERHDVETRLGELRKQKHQMETNKRKFKSEITKKCLEGTKDGRALLAQVAQLKTQMRQKLSGK